MAGGDAVKGWAVRAVQWPPARNGIKYAVHAGANVRGKVIERTGKVPAIGNIYATGSPKVGSQWIKAVFEHPIVQRHTGLFTLPQLDFQTRVHKAFPAGTFVPGLYFSHSEYLRLPKPRPYRTVYLYRDPRDLVVSGYYSAIGTHRFTNPDTERFRSELRVTERDDAIVALIEDGAFRLRELASWVDVPEDEHLIKVRLEDVSKDEDGETLRILHHCEVHLSPDEEAQVLRDVSRESLQQRDLTQRKEGSESHYRVDRKGFRDVLQPAHLELIERIIPGVIARMGYPE